MNKVKHVIDVVMAFIAGGALLQILPALAALASLTWYGVQLYDRFKKRK